MAIKVISVNKQADDRYSVIVQDDTEIVGKDGEGVNIYWSESVTYNPTNGKDLLKTKIENLIVARKALDADKVTVLTDIKTIIESIDPTKLGV